MYVGRGRSIHTYTREEMQEEDLEDEEAEAKV